MAGFEGPRDPGVPGSTAPKLPSWAVTRKESDDESSDSPQPAAVEPGPVAPPGPAPPPPMARVPEHPFDVNDPFGDEMGGVASPWNRPPTDDSDIRVVDLADEFELTTAQALEVCAISGTSASSGAAWLSAEQAAAFRDAVATYDRTAASAETYPGWAVPPGGRRPPATATTHDIVPGAMLLERKGPADADDGDDDGGWFRWLLVAVAVVAVAAIVALVVVELTR